MRGGRTAGGMERALGSDSEARIVERRGSKGGLVINLVRYVDPESYEFGPD